MYRVRCLLRCFVSLASLASRALRWLALFLVVWQLSWMRLLRLLVAFLAGIVIIALFFDAQPPSIVGCS